MRHPLLTGLVTSLTSVIGCAGPADSVGGVSVTRTDSAGTLVVTVAGDPMDLPLMVLSETPMTVVSGDTEPFLSEVGEVAFRSDGSLLVEDDGSAQLHLFDADGQWVSVISGEGDGPGEMRNLTALSVGTGDTLHAYDRRLARVSTFDAAGDLVGMVGVERELAGTGTIARDVWAFDSGRYLLHSMGRIDSVGVPTGPRLEQRAAVLSVLDATGTSSSDPLGFSGGLSTMGQRFDGVSPFGNETVVAVGSDRVVFGSGVAYELVLATPAMEIETVVRWPGWARPLQPQTVQAVRDSMAARFARISQADPERLAAVLDAIFAPELIPASLPVLGDALVDRQGRIWVSRFWPATEPWRQEDAWHVLDPSGVPIARLSLPGRSRLGAVGDDRIALIMLDEFDVQHVRVFGVAFEGGT